MRLRRIRFGKGTVRGGCHKPVNAKIIGVFDTVDPLGCPENRCVDFSERDKPYAFHSTNLHPGEDSCLIEFQPVVSLGFARRFRTRIKHFLSESAASPSVPHCGTCLIATKA